MADGGGPRFETVGGVVLDTTIQPDALDQPPLAQRRQMLLDRPRLFVEVLAEIARRATWMGLNVQSDPAARCLAVQDLRSLVLPKGDVVHVEADDLVLSGTVHEFDEIVGVQPLEVVVGQFVADPQPRGDLVFVQAGRAGDELEDRSAGLVVEQGSLDRVEIVVVWRLVAPGWISRVVRRAGPAGRRCLDCGRTSPPAWTRVADVQFPDTSR